MSCPSSVRPFGIREQPDRPRGHPDGGVALGAHAQRPQRSCRGKLKAPAAMRDDSAKAAEPSKPPLPDNRGAERSEAAGAATRR